jgi:transposase InsO family protein
VHAELAALGIHVGRKRVARLMRALGVCGVSRRQRPRTTRRDEAHRPAPDLVARDFAAAGPDRLWVADLTYIPTGAGVLYLAVVVDAWSRRVIGWAMESHLRTALVLAALDMAVEQRQPVDVIHHSDQGCQYTSIAFGLRCREAGVRRSMGSVGVPRERRGWVVSAARGAARRPPVMVPRNRGHWRGASSAEDKVDGEHKNRQPYDHADRGRRLTRYCGPPPEGAHTGPNDSHQPGEEL